MLKTKKVQYLWLGLKIIISGIILYLVYLDILFIVSYTELEKMALMERDELLHYIPELGLFNVGFWAVGGVVGFLDLFGKMFAWILPILIIAINIVLMVTIFLAVLIFKEKGKLLFISTLILFSLVYIFLGGFTQSGVEKPKPESYSEKPLEE